MSKVLMFFLGGVVIVWLFLLVVIILARFIWGDNWKDIDKN